MNMQASFIDALANALANAIAHEADACSLGRFCHRHGITLQNYYKLAAQGLAPRTFHVGTRVLVSREAAADWRREREEARAALSLPAEQGSVGDSEVRA
jgi:hypothetical protein